MVKDAIRRVDVAERRIEVNLDFLGCECPSGLATSAAQSRREIDVFTLFPEWFEWFTSQRHVAQRARRGLERSSA